jgi:integrase
VVATWLPVPIGNQAAQLTEDQRVAAIRITKRSVDALRPGAKDVISWDADLGGFGVRCRTSGARVYVSKYRHLGRQRWITIGQHGAPWTPDLARKEARRLLGEVAAGRDPAGARDSGKAAPTVNALIDRFLADHVESKRKARTGTEYRRLFDKLIRPTLGRHRVEAVTRAEVARLHHQHRATPYQANRVLAVLSKLFNWAERHGFRPDGSNPCRHVEKFREEKRERFLSGEEMARLGRALVEAEHDGSEMPSVIHAIRLLIFSGARLSEILTLRWSEVDLERGCLRLADSKTGKKVIHLNAPALELLATIPRIEGNPYVIPGRKAEAHLVNLEKPWRRIRARAGLEDVRLHDLRHSFASVGAAAGYGLPVIGALLGHTQAATTHRYAHLAADPLRQATDAIGRRIAEALEGPSADHDAKTVPLRR